ncbi:ribosome silencing factor [Kovacikia minuta CCNUW1]|uniref:ribosome silencing factor n=1 Tax=Kovacikia minuta TaxID=2931930 RepID=UPI001CCC9BFA|nr:ribosome silencing factor [Kovacikia minuta]UBF28414.1 ribosome silencing factor [Kovacikia minuta CCNUW1]
MPKISETQSSSVLGSDGTVSQSIDLQDSSLRLALAIAHAAEERKGADITLLRVTEVSSLADYFVIVTGFSKVQVRAIARAIEESVEQNLLKTPIRQEGQAEGSWILQDYGDVIVHILMPQERDFYGLEAFWGHAERVNVEALAS